MNKNVLIFPECCIFWSQQKAIQFCCQLWNKFYCCSYKYLPLHMSCLDDYLLVSQDLNPNIFINHEDSLNSLSRCFLQYRKAVEVPVISLCWWTFFKIDNPSLVGTFWQQILSQIALSVGEKCIKREHGSWLTCNVCIVYKSAYRSNRDKFEK